MPTTETLVQDIKLAFRTFLREKAFTATALLTFALCIGANVAIFAIVHAVLIKPLPFPQSEQLVTVNNSYPKANVERCGVSGPHYKERHTGIAAFSDSGAYRGGSNTIGEAGSPERLDSMSVTPSFFTTLQSKAVIGRTFAEEEGFYGKHQVVILSDTLWRQRFAADPNVIGRSLRVDGETKQIIGVMPRGFHFLDYKAQFWMPLCYSDDDLKVDRRHSNNQNMVARLKPGSSVAEAESQIAALNKESLKGDPFGQIAADAGFHTTVKDLKADHVAELKPVLLTLQAGVLFLLLIGGVNLTNLFLVRTSARAKALSVRQILGASRAHISLQLAAETISLAVIGGLLGLALGTIGIHLLRILAAEQLPFLNDLSIGLPVCLIILGASALVGALLALPLIWHASHGNPAAALSVESRGGTTSRAAHRLRHTLIVAQFALAFVLLAGAGLLGLSFVRVLAVKPGFQTERILTGAISMPWVKYKEEASRLALVERLFTELRSIPGVKSVGISSMVPFTDNVNNNAMWVEGYTPAPGDSLQAHYTGGITGDYFETLGYRLIEGRFLKAEDSRTDVQSCVVDEYVARRYWPGKSALGQHVFTQPPDKPDSKPFTIVGVVASVKQLDLTDKKGNGALYLPYKFASAFAPMLVLRTEQLPEGAAAAMRAAVLRVDAEMPVSDVKTMEARVDESLGYRRMPMLLAALFAGAALLLAAVGIYGVLAYAVEQRRREIGVRMALGALPNQIRTQFLGLAGKLVAVGVLLGAVGAWLAGRAMDSMLFGIGPVDSVVFGATAIVLTCVALVACLLPSMRAARVPPMEALRSE